MIQTKTYIGTRITKGKLNVTRNIMINRNTGRGNITSNILDLILLFPRLFPLPLDMGNSVLRNILNIATFPFVILVPIYVLVWITYYVLTIRKNNKVNAGLDLPFVKSAVILIVLDLVYLFGTTIGLFKI